MPSVLQDPLFLYIPTVLRENSSSVEKNQELMALLLEEIPQMLSLRPHLNEDLVVKDDRLRP